MGDRVERQVGPEAHDHDDPLVRGQPRESGEERVALDERLERVAPRGIGGRIHRDEPDDIPPAETITTAVDQDPVEPRVELVGLTERSERSPRDDQRVLDGVLGLVGVAQQETGEPVDPVEVRSRGAEKGRATRRVRVRAGDVGGSSVHR